MPARRDGLTLTLVIGFARTPAPSDGLLLILIADCAPTPALPAICTVTAVPSMSTCTPATQPVEAIGAP
jgi:hypothetical protein